MHSFIRLSCWVLLCGIPISYAADDPEVLYQQGIAYGREENYDAAIKVLSQALEFSPGNQDYRLALARVYSWKGDFPKAHALVEETLMAQPDNVEAQLLKARLLYYQKKLSNAKAMLLSITDGLPENEEVAALLAQVTTAHEAEQSDELAKLKRSKTILDKRWLLAAGLDYSTLTRSPQPDWVQYFLQLGYQVSTDLFTHFRFENTERFNTHNEHFELGAVYKFTDDVIGHFSSGYTANATFIPEFRLKTGGQARIIRDHRFLGDAWLTFDVQYDRFSGDIEIKTFKPGLSYAVLDGVVVSGKFINILDDSNEHLQGWSARIDWQTPWDRLRLNVGLANAPESLNRTTIETKSKAVGAAIDINDNVTLYLAYVHDDRKNSFIRNSFSSAVVFKF